MGRAQNPWPLHHKITARWTARLRQGRDRLHDEFRDQYAYAREGLGSIGPRLKRQAYRIDDLALPEVIAQRPPLVDVPKVGH